jgi:hypothetical protein
MDEQRAILSDEAARTGTFDEVLGLLMLRQSVVSRTDRAEAIFSLYEQSRDSALAEAFYRYAEAEKRIKREVAEEGGELIQIAAFLLRFTGDKTYISQADKESLKSAAVALRRVADKLRKETP